MKFFSLQKIALVALIMFSAGSLFISCKKLNEGPATRAITPSVTVSTLAGGGVGDPATITSSVYGSIGSADGTGNAASFYAPAGVVMDVAGNLYISETGNCRIRKVTPAGVVSTLAGACSISGFVNGTGIAATFSSIQGIAIDASGNLYIADSGNAVIRKVTPNGVVSTFAGNGVVGFTNGTASSASFNAPTGLAFDVSGNLYVADFGNKAIRKITTDGTVSTLAGTGVIGYDNGPGSAATFTSPARLAVDGSGNVFVSDLSLVRKITPDGTVSTFAGNATAAGGNATRADGKGTAAGFVVADGISIDANGNIFLGDENVVRKITPDGTVTTLAGGGAGVTTDGPGNQASFGILRGLVVNPAGNLVYVADYSTSLIRKIQIN